MVSRLTDIEQDVLTLKATSEIVIQTGEASITLKRNGDIIISGVNINLESTAATHVKAGSTLDLASAGPLVIKGTIVNIN